MKRTHKSTLTIAAALFAVFATVPLSAETVTYKYDGVGRVVAACYGTQNKHYAFHYDDAGNRTQVKGAGGCLNIDPIAMNDSVSGSYYYYDVVDVFVLTNDSDPDGDTITVTGASCVASGCSVTYTSTKISVMGYDPGSAKTVSYTISDGNGGTASASATVSSFQDPCPFC